MKKDEKMADDIKKMDNKEEDKEINFSKKKMIYGSNEYGDASSELCRSNENEYGRTDYDERARKELIRNSRRKNVMSSNTGSDTEKIVSADSIILKLNKKEILDQLNKKRGESDKSSDLDTNRGESGERIEKSGNRGESVPGT